MYKTIKEKCKYGYVVPSIIDDVLCDMLAEICDVAQSNKYEKSSYSEANRQQIRNSIRSLFSYGKTDYDNNELFYSLYYLPNNIFKIWVPLTDLLHRNLLQENLHVLELGCGPGTSTFGLLEFYREMATINSGQKYSVEIDVVEKQKNFLGLLKKIFREYVKI